MKVTVRGLLNNGYTFLENLKEFLKNPFYASIISSSLSGIIIGLVLKFNQGEFVFYLLIALVVFCSSFALFSQRRKISLAKLKMEGELVLSTVHYILESRERWEKFNDYNLFDFEFVDVTHTFDSRNSSSPEYMETISWSVSGTVKSVEPVTEINQHLLSPFRNGFGVAKLRYVFQMRDCKKYGHLPSIINRAFVCETLY